MNGLDFRLKPGLTGYDLPDHRFLMQAPLTALNPFEMLDGIGDINLVARNARFDERFVEKSTCGSDEGMALAVFHVSRLLTDKHHRRIFGTFAENRLGSIFI
jgi:hypothetical protein